MGRKEIQYELKRLVELLDQEKREDLRIYRQKMSSTSLVERRKQGVCWYPVRMERTSYDAGERLLVRVARGPDHRDSHLFQSGKLVSLFSNQTGMAEEDSVNGVVNQVGEEQMLITINADEFPHWIGGGKLGVQLLFDENSYKEMEVTLRELIKTREERINALKEILLGSKAATFSEARFDRAQELNESQQQAVELIQNASDLAIVHGPPGTGKTTTLVNAIQRTIREEQCVLVCAPSNAAVDLLVEKLSNREINVVRIGHPARVTENILNCTLDARKAHHIDYKDLKTLRRKSEEFRSMAKKYKRNFGHAEREQRRILFAEARKYQEDAEQLEFYIINSILSKAEVIATTLVGANNYNLKGMSVQKRIY